MQAKELQHQTAGQTCVAVWHLRPLKHSHRSAAVVILVQNGSNNNMSTLGGATNASQVAHVRGLMFKIEKSVSRVLHVVKHMVMIIECQAQGSTCMYDARALRTACATAVTNQCNWTSHSLGVQVV